MEVYVMVIFMYIGAPSDKESNAVTAIEFNSKESCESAINPIKGVVGGLSRTVKAVCVKK